MWWITVVAHLALVASSILPTPNSKETSLKVAKEILGENAIHVKTTSVALEELHEKWLNQAFSALMSTVAQEKIEQVHETVAEKHERCARSAHTIGKHAKCVTELLDAKQDEATPTVEADEWIGSFQVRSKREIQSATSYRLRSASDQSPFVRIANQITNSIRALKNKKETRSWREIVENVKEKGKKLEESKRVQDMLRHGVGAFLPSRMASRRRLRMQPKQAYSSSEQIKDRLNGLKLNGNINYRNRQLSGDGNPKGAMDTLLAKQQMLPMSLIRDSVKLGLTLTGRNSSIVDGKSIKLASPRFFSLVPEEDGEKTVNIISPSLFSIHSEGKGIENMTSLGTGFGLIKKKEEHNALMDMITEVSGIGDAVDDAAKKIDEQSEGSLTNSKGEAVQLSKKNITDIYGEEGYRSIKVMEKLHSMYTKEQMDQFNTTGYALMTKEQRELMYGKGAPFEDHNALHAADNMTFSELKGTMHRTIRHVAQGHANFSRRMKDIVLSPVLLTPLVLAPEVASQALVLSPAVFVSLILSPAVFGSVILSPWVFVPVVLAPRLMSPVILSPALFSPIILSPLALDPVVLSPGVGNPFILSPFVLTPVVLSPQVMTPIVLSPFALSPQILSPFVLSPLVLSPFVLSPVVLSPPSLTALILSPYALSPNILSPPTVITVVASPSFLS